MKLKKLELVSFRNHLKRELRLRELNVIMGENARGKTNILEAIYLLATGNSFRAGKIEEMIDWQQDLARVEGYIEDDEGNDVVLGVTLTRGVLMGKRTPKRKYFVDRVARQKRKFVGNLMAVVFRPEDLRLIEGSPGRRRKFLDEVLGMVSWEYARALTLYEGALRRRNKILDLIRDGRARREELMFWDMTLIKNGNILTEMRREFLEFLSGLEVSFGKYEVEYDFSAISDSRLKQYEREEVLAGYTLVGPHKDDFMIRSPFTVHRLPAQAGSRWKDLHVYGSRGEQRLAVLFLKYGSLKYVEHKLGKVPMFLLDDIFSELDEKHRLMVLEMMEGRQTIITSADRYILDDLRGREVEVVSL